MAVVNYFRNPRFKTDTNQDGFADGIDTAFPGFNGTNKPTGSILTLASYLADRGVTDYHQFMYYTYGSDEGSLAYIWLGETAAGMKRTPSGPRSPAAAGALSRSIATEKSRRLA